MSAISKQLFAQKPNEWNRLDTLFSKGKAGGTPTSTNKELKFPTPLYQLFE